MGRVFTCGLILSLLRGGDRWCLCPFRNYFVSVSADVTAALSGLTAVSNQANATAQAFRTAAPAALLFVGAAASVGAVLTSSITSAADFEHQMSGIKSVLTVDELAQFGGALDALALKLGRDTVFTSRQAAAAIEELIKAGVPVAAVLEGAGAAALNLASATGVTTAEAATIAAQAMNTFGLQAGNLTEVVDRLSSVASASASDVSFLRFGLAAVGGVAAGVGLSFNDTAVALGLMSSRFATGADAGTSFKAFLNGLIPDSKKQITLFKQLGLITEENGNAFFDEAGHLRNLEQIAGTLHDSLAGLTDMQRQQALTTIFGTDGQRAANALFALGADAVQQFSNQTAESGAASRSAQTRLDNLQGALNNLGGSVETVQIIIGRLFLPTLRNIADVTRSVVDRFSSLSPETQKLAVFIAAGAAAFVGFLGVMVLLGAIIPPLVVSFAALNAILLLNPIGLVVTAIAALIAIGVVAFNTNEDFRNSVLALWDAIQNQLFPAIGAVVSAIGDQLGPVVASLSEQFNNFVTAVGPSVVEFFQTTLPGALAAMGTQIESLGPLFTALGGFFGAMFNLVSALVAINATALQGFFENVLVPGLQALGTALAPLQPQIDSVAGALNPLVEDMRTIGERLQPVTDFFTNLTAAINGAALAIAAFQLPDFLRPAGATVPAAVPSLAGAVPTGAVPAGGAGGPLVSIGQVTIGSDVDADRFIARMAGAIADAAGRVPIPPDNSSHPTLLPSVT